MQIAWPQKTVNDTIQNIRNAIGRSVTINVKTQGEACPICDLDPVTNLSVDPWCAVCSGSYWINTISGTLVSGHVLWGTAESPLIRAGGVVPEGDCKVTIIFSDENERFVNLADTFIVDGKIMSLKSYRLRGVPTPNRIAIFLVEEGKDG